MAVGFLFDNTAGVISFLSVPIAGSGSAVVVGDYTTAPGAVAVRDVVYLSADDTVAVADADNVATVPALGVVVSVTDPTTCKVMLQGELGGFVGLVANTDYFLSTTPGQITASSPLASGSISQKIGRARDTTTLVVNCDLDYVVN